MNFQQYNLLAGRVVLLIVAVMSFRDRANPRRITTGLFWGCTAWCSWSATGLTACWATCWRGQQRKRVLHIIVGGVVVVMALIAGFGGVRLDSYHQRTPQEREASAKRLGNKLFILALAIPVVTVIGVLLFNNVPALQSAVFGSGNTRR